MHKTSFYSYKLNNLAKGCRLCVQGRKSVFFVTGICPEKCFYCPISEQKYKKDVVYINEWPTREWNNIKQEIKLCSSKGVGITGGDPLSRLERTADFIKRLKKEFGKKFHIHLYTPLTLVNEKSLKKLFDAGLDEIRFHPNLENPDRKSWEKIKSAKRLKWKTGVEIPVLPNKGQLIKELIDYLVKINIDFLNLNELEYSDTNAMHMEKYGLKTKDKISYAIKGSEELAFQLLDYIEKKYPKMNVHFCTAKLKDKVQMRKRIQLRAENTKKSFDRVSEDGTLIRGAIYLSEFLPSTRKKLSSIDEKKRKNITKKLKELKSVLKNELGIKEIELDTRKLRLLTSEKTARTLAKDIQPKLFRLAIVEEYPTYDEFEVEIEFL